MSGREFTQSQIEWAAECLCGIVWGGEGDGELILDPCDLAAGRHALEHGYVPPPRPMPVREEMIEAMRVCSHSDGWILAPTAAGFADAILSRFVVTRKSDG